MGVLKVRVNGVWEDVTATQEPPLDEVWIGAGPPDPTGTYEIWVDNTTPSPTASYRSVTGDWQPFPESEVEIGPVDPFLTNPSSRAELWLNRSIGQSGKLFARYGNLWHPVSEFTESEVEINSTDPVDQGIPAGSTELWIDTSTTPPTLNAWVNGGWQALSAPDSLPAPQEVEIGPSQPRETSVELWYDTTATPGALFANNNGNWEPVGGANEVTVSDTDPRVTDPTATDELWYDTGAGVPGTLNAWVNTRWVPILNLATGVSYEQQYGQAPNPGSLNTLAREDHTHGTPAEEVVVSDTDPYDNPDSAAELWYDTTTTTTASSSEPGSATSLNARIAQLEARIAQLENASA